MHTASSHRMYSGGSTRRILLDLYESLVSALGPSGWWPAETPFEVCVGAVLTQNAPWGGVVKAITALKERGIFSPEGITKADEAALAEALRPTVYFNQKARRLRAFCGFLLDRYGGDVERLRDHDPADVRSQLLALPRNGRETADSMLLYALDMPVFVVDAYTHRILSRHGMIDENVGYEELRGYFEDVLEPDPRLFNEFHALLCRVGAGYCKKKPRCAECPARLVLGEPDR